jgi:23S rRNA (cytidine1920-2'-O)/16S rRNA (cytidine1409-2'-O)-methyltransferase
LSVVGLTNSPIKGGDGNTEYLLYLKNESNPVNHISLDDIEILVKSQFED